MRSIYHELLLRIVPDGSCAFSECPPTRGRAWVCFPRKPRRDSVIGVDCFARAFPRRASSPSLGSAHIRPSIRFLGRPWHPLDACPDVSTGSGRHHEVSGHGALARGIGKKTRPQLVDWRPTPRKRTTACVTVALSNERCSWQALFRMRLHRNGDSVLATELRR